MIGAYPVAQVRDAEAAAVAAAPADELMLGAAQAVANRCATAIKQAGQEVPGSVICGLIGGGDNGGDGLYALSFLAEAGAAAIALVCCDTPHERAEAAALAAGVEVKYVNLAPSPARVARTVVSVARQAGVWIDALAGTGVTGQLRRPLRDIVKALQQEKDASPDEPIVVAVDQPSGIGGDGGAIAGPFLTADYTVTMGEVKPGAVLAPAMHGYGKVEVVELDLGYLGRPAVTLLDGLDIRDILLLPGHDDHKYTRGVVQVIAGSTTYPMTGVLCAHATARAGAGMVRYHGPEEAMLALVTRCPEVVPSLGRYDTLLTGSGVDGVDSQRVRQMVDEVRQASAHNLPVVLDAGALNQIEKLQPYLSERTVLTPHAGEAATALTRLGAGTRRGGITRAEVESDPAHWVVELAERSGATVVLKGAQTLIFSPAGQLYATRLGSAWTATAGAGDVLAGTIAAVIANSYARARVDRVDLSPSSIAKVATAGVWIHARAALLAAHRFDIKPSAERAAQLRAQAQPIVQVGGAKLRGPRLRGAQTLQLWDIDEPGLGFVGGAGAPIIATDIIDAIPRAWASLTG